MSINKAKAVFFDRDGVLVQSVDGEAPQRVKDMALIPQMYAVVKTTKNCGFLNIIVSNQPDIALGLIDEQTKRQLEEKFLRLIKSENLPIDDIYYCHHHPKGVVRQYAIDCDCRKPKPGMIMEASQKWSIDLKGSFMVGDRASDVKAGQAAGVTTVLYDPTGGQQSYLAKLAVTPDHTVDDFAKIISLVCEP